MKRNRPWLHNNASWAVVGMVLLALGWHRGLLYSQAEGVGVEVDNALRTLRVRFGVNDKEPGKWDGTATVTGGSILQIRNWHPRKGDRVDHTG